MNETTNTAPNLAEYDHIIVAFSGGKDSLGCLLALFEAGVDRSKIELWHHDIDGREGSTLMDWSVTRSYCSEVAKAFDLPIYFSWLEGGFEREMNRKDQRKAPTVWENPDGTLGRSGGIRGKLATRQQFPQVSPDLSVRWCSAYLKIDVMDAALTGQERFVGKKTLVLTGERAEESAGRAKYKEFEPHRRDNRNGKRTQRHVDHWRPVHKWTIQQVWELIKKYSVNPHPAYRAGFGRVSCQFCIFGNANQFASAKAISPDRFETVANYEASFGKTIKRKEDLRSLTDKGTPYVASQADVEACRSHAFNEPVILAKEDWKLPAGAYAESCGPV
jgi:3'-phosphoadenosine 5'-phosphosulfate sulfotransferase (PAPS reductase)/FAD synthetase